jgi:hypothetical protein
VSDGEEGKQEKLPTDEELPTSADDDENKKEEQLDDYVSRSPAALSTISEVRTGSCPAVNSARKS